MRQAELVQFPGLGLSFELDRVAFQIGGLAIYWYGLLIAVGFLLGVLYCLRRAETFGVSADDFLDALIGSVLVGVVGARAYYVAFRWDTYQGDIIKILSLRGGGLAIYGGIIAGILAGCFFARIKKIPLLAGLDLVSAGLLLAQGIGRWGNFVNIEAFGANTAMPWGMTSAHTIPQYLARHQAELAAMGIAVDPAMPVHPTFLYESLWCLLGFALIAMALTKRRQFAGQIILFYAGWYGAGRFVIEGLRTDSLMWGRFRVSQMVALACVVVSAVLMAALLSRPRRERKEGFPPTAAVREAEAAVTETQEVPPAADNANTLTEAPPAPSGREEEK